MIDYHSLVNLSSLFSGLWRSFNSFIKQQGGDPPREGRQGPFLPTCLFHRDKRSTIRHFPAESCLSKDICTEMRELEEPQAVGYLFFKKPRVRTPCRHQLDPTANKHEGLKHPLRTTSLFRFSTLLRVGVVHAE